MSIRFDCPVCNKNLVVHDRFEGRTVRCPQCDDVVSVPTMKQLEEARKKQIEEEREKARLAKEDELILPDMIVDEDDDYVEAAMIEPVAIAVAPKSKRKALQREKHEEEDLEWDITPMVDVAFLLLIFFMLTASFSIQKVIRTAPQKNDQESSNAIPKPIEEVPEENLVLQVDEFNTYTVIAPSGESLEASSRQELIVHLRELRAQYADQAPRMVIQAHEDSMHGAVVTAMDAAREADFVKFQLFAVENFD